MAWAYLILAGLFEIVFASTLKLAEGFTKPLATVVFLVSIVASFLLLSRAATRATDRHGLAVWTGIGAAGTVIVGMILYDEPATALRLFFLTTLIGSIIGLKLASPT
jgi:quaternary ammonium compound-resistance protein SugE